MLAPEPQSAENGLFEVQFSRLLNRFGMRKKRTAFTSNPGRDLDQLEHVAASRIRIRIPLPSSALWGDCVTILGSLGLCMPCLVRDSKYVFVAEAEADTILALPAAGRQAATKSSSQRNHRRWSGTGTGLAHVELRVGGGPRRDESAQPGQLLCHAALALCYSCRCPVQSCRQRQPGRIRILFTIYGPLTNF